MNKASRHQRGLLADGAFTFFLWGVAVAQPLFDLLARGAEFFVVRRSEPLDILILAAILSGLIPALLMLIQAAAGLLGKSARTCVHLIIVASLIAATILPICNRSLLLPGWAQTALATGLGAVGAALYSRLRRLRAGFFLVVLTLITLVFPITFLLNSSISKLLLPARDIGADATKVNATTPVIMVIFDELALVSLMDRRQQVDPIRYPNFSKLAQESTWYRNASTVADNTVYAVPAILTGKYPRKRTLPTAEDHSSNLFTWLGGSYDLNVVESYTQLCPADLCQNREIRPRLYRRLVSLLADLSLVYCHILLPADLAANLPSISGTWEDFWGDSAEPRTPGDQGRAFGKRASLFRDFTESIRPRMRRVLHYLHVPLPHIPWEHLPSGKRYGPFDSSRAPHGLSGNKWSTDEWHAIQGYQRYLLQLGFADKLLGELLAKLIGIGLYDRSLIIVTSDHGVSFRPGDSRRGLSETNHHDIMPVPLFIKSPHQESGEIDDSNVQTIDIIPTIADILNVELPWPVDGKSARRPSSGSVENKTIYHNHAKMRLVIEDDPGKKYASLTRQVELFGTGVDRGGLYAIGAFKKLVGCRIEDLEVSRTARHRVELDGPNVFANVHIDDPLSPTHITGRVTSETIVGDIHPAVTVNNVVQAVTQSYREGGSTRFSALISPQALTAGRNRLEFFAILSEIDEPPRLARLERSHQAYSLETTVDGSPEVVISPDGRVFSVRGNGLGGIVVRAAESDGVMELSGWAPDRKNAEPPQTFVVFDDEDFIFAGKPNTEKREPANKLPRIGFKYRFPTRLISDLGNSDIRVFALLPKGVASELTYFTGYPWVKKYRLATESGVEVLQTIDGTSMLLGSRALRGYVSHATVKNGVLMINGWAADIESCDGVKTIVMFLNGEFFHAGAASTRQAKIAERYDEERMQWSGFRFRARLEKFGNPTIREVRLFAVSKSNTAVELPYYVGYPWSRKYSLLSETEDGGENLMRSDGRLIPILPEAFQSLVQPLRYGNKGTTIRGWAVDVATLETPATIAIFADGEFRHAGPTGVEYHHLASRFGDEALRYAGFRFRLPKELAADTLNTELRVFAISTTGYASELKVPSSYPSSL